MKNKELIDTLHACGDKELSNSIFKYIEHVEGLSERGIQESLDELLEVKQYLILHNMYQNRNTYTEIGSAEGGSLWIYAHMFLEPGGVINIIEIKPRAALYKIISDLQKEGFIVNLYTENSDRTPGWIIETDILFIDGDHSYLGVSTDFNRYYPVVSKGGLCLLHDTTSFPGCVRLKNELKSKLDNVVTVSGGRCLHTMLDTFEETQQACFAKGNFDFFYKELETGTTIVPKP